MATETQSKYIADLVVLKTKEFKEVKELLLANEIIGADAETVLQAESIAEINNALTEHQASLFIDVLISTKEPVRTRVYATRRAEQVIGGLEDIKSVIEGWSF